MTDCPQCGYHDPFMRSYWDHEKEVAEPIYFKEWDLEIWQALQENPWIQVGENVMYHLTKGGTVERWNVYVLIARKGGKVQFDTGASQRKNWHIKGKKSANDQG